VRAPAVFAGRAARVGAEAKRMAEAREPKPGRSRRWKWWVILALALAAGLYFFWPQNAVKPGTVLVLDFAQRVEERPPQGVLRWFSAEPLHLLGLWSGLERAAQDSRVAGVLVKVQAGSSAPGSIDELRGLLERFRASGKFVVAYMSAPDTLAYLLASAADEVLIDRSTTLDTVGLRLTAFFLRDALAQIGIEPDLIRVGEYKGAYEELALPGPTAEFEESMNAIVDSIHSTIVGKIAASRRLDEDKIRSLFDRAPMQPEAARADGFVDRVVSAEEVDQVLESRTKGPVHLLPMEEYVALGRSPRGAVKLAVIYIVGPIVEGPQRDVPYVGSSTGAEAAVRALHEASRDPTITGVILRVDSPGGVVSASEKIHEAVAEARKLKPLIASFGASAASGGYYAGCAAEKIIAHPGTFTGSIGVFGGKVVVGGLLERLRVEAKTYARGRRAGLNDLTRRYSAEDRLAVKELLEESYRRFVVSVANGRRRAFDEIQTVARGRVWTGKAALGVGLVDGLGGIGEAVDALRALAKIDAASPVELVERPAPPTLWESISGSAPRDAAAAAARSEVVALVGPEAADAVRYLEALRQLGLTRGTSQLSLLPFALDLR
jgi:protease-4